MEFVIREKKPNETVWKVKYYDTDLNTSGNLSEFSFESAEVAEAYGKVHYAYENTGNSSYQGVVEVKEEGAGYMTSDANHWGIMFYSKSKERLQKFSWLLEKEGAAMCSIVPAFKCEKLVICDIDKEWDESEDINPFYFWYYKADEAKEMVAVDIGDYEEPENSETEEDWAEYERKLKEEEECVSDLFWEDMEDALLGRRRRQ